VRGDREPARRGSSGQLNQHTLVRLIS